MDRNLPKLDMMRTRYSGDVIIEDMRDEAFVAITSLKEGLEVTDLIEVFGVTTRYDCFQHSRRLREEKGGLAVPVWY